MIFSMAIKPVPQRRSARSLSASPPAMKKSRRRARCGRITAIFFHSGVPAKAHVNSLAVLSPEVSGSFDSPFNERRH
jgi:hypothetical protein